MDQWRAGQGYALELENAWYNPRRSEPTESGQRRTGWVRDEDVNRQREDACGGWMVGGT